ERLWSRELGRFTAGAGGCIEETQVDLGVPTRSLPAGDESVRVDRDQMRAGQGEALLGIVPFGAAAGDRADQCRARWQIRRRIHVIPCDLGLQLRAPAGDAEFELTVLDQRLH